MLPFIKCYSPLNDRFVKHTVSLFPLFVTCLKGATETVSSLPLLYHYTTFPCSFPLHFLLLKPLLISFVYGDEKHSVRSIISHLLYSLANASNGQVSTFSLKITFWKAKWLKVVSG